MNKQLIDKTDENKVALAYSSACESIKAPKELYGKVMDMSEEKIRLIRIRRLAVIAAAFLVIIVASNAITYAVAGQGWIGKVFVTMDSSPASEIEFEEMVDQWGRTYYFGRIQQPNGKGLCIGTYDPTVLEGKSFRVDGDKIIVIDADGNERVLTGMESDAEGYTAVLAIPTLYPQE